LFRGGGGVGDCGSGWGWVSGWLGEWVGVVEWVAG
jgi:hypothetical protein